MRRIIHTMIQDSQTRMPLLTTSEDFLLAAKHAEIAALQQLQVNCRLVGRVTELIHELQREQVFRTYILFLMVSDMLSSELTSLKSPASLSSTSGKH